MSYELISRQRTPGLPYEISDAQYSCLSSANQTKYRKKTVQDDSASSYSGITSTNDYCNPALPDYGSSNNSSDDNSFGGFGGGSGGGAGAGGSWDSDSSSSSDSSSYDSGSSDSGSSSSD